MIGTYTASKYALVVVAVEAVFAAVFFVDYVLSVTAEAVSCRISTAGGCEGGGEAAHQSRGKAETVAS